MPTGIIINVGAVVIGGLGGSILSGNLSDSIKEPLNTVLGLCAFCMGISAVVLMKNMPAVVLAVILGSLAGYLLKISSTIQLGATVDYAILMTTRYKRERSLGNDKKTSVTTALETSMPSIMVSALGFFAATFGVAVYSDIDIISSMCSLMARGAIVSMLCVIFVLPAMFILLDKVICATSLGFKSKKSNGGI